MSIIGGTPLLPESYAARCMNSTRFVAKIGSQQKWWQTRDWLWIRWSDYSASGNNSSNWQRGGLPNQDCPPRTVRRTSRSFSTAWPVLGRVGRHGPPTGSRPAHPVRGARAWIRSPPCGRRSRRGWSNNQRPPPKNCSPACRKNNLSDFRAASCGLCSGAARSTGQQSRSGPYSVPPPRGNRPRRAIRRPRRLCPSRSFPARDSMAEPSSRFPSGPNKNMRNS